MAIVMQTLLDTFAAKVVSKLSFITVGGQQSSLEGKGTDKKVSLRVIDPSGAVSVDNSTVGSNSNAITVNALNEKKIDVPMAHYYTAVGASLIDEAVSIKDADLQKHLEVEATNVAEKIRKDSIKNIYKANTAFVGGWEDVESASGFVGDIAEGSVYGFIGHKAKSKLSVSQPFGSQVGEKLYRASEIGAGKDGSYFYNEKNMPTISLTSDSFTVSATISNGAFTALTITGTTGTQTLPAGTPVTLVGLKACDALGNVTDEDAVIILKEAVAPSSKVYTLTNKFEAPILSGAGRQIADEDGTDAVSGDITGASIPATGTYFLGFLKVNNANAYGSVGVKGKGTEYKETNVDGIVISMNAVSDTSKVDIVDAYRFDCYLAQGVVDPRLTSLVLIKK